MAFIARTLQSFRPAGGGAPGGDTGLWDGLIHYYPLNEVSGAAIDVVGGEDIPDRGTTLSSPHAMLGAARDPEGSDGFNTTSNSTGGPLSLAGNVTRTMACWAVCNQKTRHIWGRNNEFSVSITNGDNLQFANDQQGSGELTSDSVIIALNTWFLATIFVDPGNNIRGVSLNGEPFKTDDKWDFNNVSARSSIGNSNGAEIWNGPIQGLGVWDRRLIEREVYELYRSGPGSFRDESNIIVPNFDAPVFKDEIDSTVLSKRSRFYDSTSTSGRAVACYNSVPLTVHDKVVCAFKVNTGSGIDAYVGVGDIGNSLTAAPGQSQASWAYQSSGRTRHNASSSNTGWDSVDDGNDHEVVVAWDGPNTSLYWAIDGVWQGGSDPALGINAAYNNIDRNPIFFLAGSWDDTIEIEILSEEDMQIALPSGYVYGKHSGGFGNHAQFGTQFVGGQVDRYSPFFAGENGIGTRIDSISGDHWIQLYGKNYQIDYVAIEDDFNSYYGWGKDFTNVNAGAQSQGPDSYAWRNGGNFGNSLDQSLILSSWKDTVNKVISFRFENGDVFAYLDGVIENGGSPVATDIHGTIKILASFDDGGDKGTIAVDPPFGLLDGAEPLPMGGATGLFREAVGSWGFDGIDVTSASPDRLGRNDLIQELSPPFTSGPFGGAKDCGTAAKGFYNNTQSGLGLAAGDFSVSVHIRPTNNAGHQTPVAGWGSAFVAHVTGSSNAGDYWCGIQNDGELVFSRFQVAGVNATGIVRTVGAGLTDNNWYHVVMVQEAGVPKIYVNGVEQTLDTPYSTSTGWSNIGFRVGQYQIVASGYYYFGDLAELNIFPRALTQNEVTTLQTTPYS